MIEGFNNKIALYNGRTKFTTTSTPYFIYSGGEYAIGIDNIYKYNGSSLIWSKAYNTGSAGLYTQIWGISSDLAGYTYIISYTPTSPQVYKLLRYDTDGSEVISITSSRILYGVTTDIQNNAIVCGSQVSNKSVIKYDTQLNEIWSFGTASFGPYTSVNLDSSENVILTANGGQVTKLNALGVAQWTTTASSGALYSSCIDSSGNIWVSGNYNASNKNLFKLSSSGTLLSSYYIGAGGSETATQVVAGESGYIYVSSGSSLYKLDLTATQIWVRTPGASSIKRSLVFSNSLIYLKSSSSVYVYNTSGSLLNTYSIYGETMNIQIQ